MRPDAWRELGGYGAALGLAAAATAAANVIDDILPVPNLSLILALPVVIAGVRFGLGPSIAAAAAGAAGYALILPPKNSLEIVGAANVWALILLLVTAAMFSAIAAQARRRALEATRAAERAAAFEALARDIAGVSDIGAIAQCGAATLSRLAQGPAAVLIESPEGRRSAVISGSTDLSTADRRAARWALDAGRPTLQGGCPVGDRRLDFWPVTTPRGQSLALGIGRLAHGKSPPKALLETVGGYLSVALDREGYARELLETQVEAARERIKADLLAAVSHDLKTPLSTILVTLQSLRRFLDHHDAATRTELLTLAETETARLGGMVANLLDMGRLEAGAVAVKTAPWAARDLAAAAADRVALILGDRRLVNEVDRTAPVMMVDASLFETALSNVLENAVIYSPPGSTIRIRSACEDGLGRIEVLDEGPGFADSAEAMFEKFVRGSGGDGRPPGTGLGLAIAKGFLEAQGGAIAAGNRVPGKGAYVRLSAPLAPAEVTAT
jgi:two-component system sensor histidine kinase KdpD